MNECLFLLVLRLLDGFAEKPNVKRCEFSTALVDVKNLQMTSFNSMMCLSLSLAVCIYIYFFFGSVKGIRCLFMLPLVEPHCHTKWVLLLYGKSHAFIVMYDIVFSSRSTEFSRATKLYCDTMWHIVNDNKQSPLWSLSLSLPHSLSALPSKRKKNVMCIWQNCLSLSLSLSLAHYISINIVYNYYVSIFASLSWSDIFRVFFFCTFERNSKISLNFAIGWFLFTSLFFFCLWNSFRATFKTKYESDTHVLRCACRRYWVTLCNIHL